MMVSRNKALCAAALLSVVVLSDVVAQMPPGYSDDQPTAKKREVSTGLLGSAAQEDLWTAQDISVMCYKKWEGDVHSIKSCEGRSQNKIGRPKTPGDIQLLEAARQEKAN